MSLGIPWWQRAEAYDCLRCAENSAFAWEWLRRSDAYRAAWADSEASPQAFGLETFEDPALPTPEARPIWTAECDPDVVSACVNDLFPERADVIDLLRLRHLLSIAIDKRVEHLLFSDGRRFVRLDVTGGTLIGSPCSLRFDVHGVFAARKTIAAIRRVLCLVASAELPVEDPPVIGTNQRILELRTADALAAGASHAEIARVLFGVDSAGGWRCNYEPFRTRVQRLVRRARLRTQHPLQGWFRD